MKVELTEAQVAAVVASAKAEVKTRLVDAVMACFNIQQLAAEIKNETVKQAAQQIVRAHRLWEAFLDKHFDLPSDHLHDPAERMEHFLDPELQAELDQELAGQSVDPHGKQIPPAPGN